jgi:hypothetical protein
LFSQFFNEDFWRNVVAGLVVVLLAAIVMSATAVAMYKYVFRQTMSAGRTIAFFFAMTVFLFVGMGIIALGFHAQSGAPVSDSRLSDVDKKISSVQSTVEIIASQQARLFWQPMTKEQKNEIAAAMIKMGTRRLMIWRNPSTDCSMLADQFASLAQSPSVNWNLLTPPYDPVGSEGTGITIVAPDTDTQAESLKQVISTQLGVSVGKQPPETMAGTLGPDGKPPDLGIYVGVKSTPAMEKTGIEKIQIGATTALISVVAPLPYSVTGRASWGATFTYEAAAGHFTVTFSAPASGDSPLFAWQIFHYQ